MSKQTTPGRRWNGWRWENVPATPSAVEAPADATANRPTGRPRGPGGRFLPKSTP